MIGNVVYKTSQPGGCAAKFFEFAGAAAEMSLQVSESFPWLELYFMAVNSLGGEAASTTSSAQERWLGTDWRAEAACSQDAGTKLFFPVGVTGPAEIQIRQAKAVCGECPVKAECLDFAI